MTTLAGKREELRAALAAAELAAFSTVPEVVTPPLAFVTPNEPYVTLEGASFGGVIVHHQISLVASPGVNEVTADELDQMVQTALVAVADLIGTLEVGRPGSISLNNQTHIAVAIDVTTEIRLEDS